MIANIHDAKTHFSEYLARALAGEEVIVAKAGKPVAKIVPFEKSGSRKGKVKPKGAKPKKRKLGQYKGWVVPDSAFEPMTKEELKDWYDGPVFP